MPRWERAWAVISQAIMAYVVKAESKADLVIPFLPVRTQLEFEERNVWGGGWNVQVELQLLDRENELDVKALR